MARLRDDRPETSPRSLQRHFLQVTGLTSNRIRRIIRASTAAELIGRGECVVDVTDELRYADQAYLTRDLSTSCT